MDLYVQLKNKLNLKFENKILDLCFSMCSKIKKDITYKPINNILKVFQY
jgi:hypothetical protein